VTWSMVSARAPYAARDALAGEITDAGLIVIAGGQAGGYTMNDVWVSADGGYTWGACSTEAYRPDRREMSTVLDRSGYLYIIGGRANTAGNAQQFNDVYRSSFSFNDLARVSAACQVNIPACGPGLSCWPGTAGTNITQEGVTCPAIARCQAARPPSSSTGRRSSSSSSSTGKKRPIIDPCDDWPEPGCWNWIPSSTGLGNGKPSGLGAWAIGGIVVLVVAVVGGLAIFFWRRYRGTAGQVSKPASDSLLGDTRQHTDV